MGKEVTILKNKNTEITAGQFGLSIRHRGEPVVDIQIPKWAIRRLVRMKKEGKSNEIKKFLLKIFRDFVFVEP